MARTASRESPWLRGPIWDSLWVLSMFWIVPLVFWLARSDAESESSPLNLFYFAIVALFWVGHRLCSTWLAYCTEAYRPLWRSQPLRFIVVPLLITAACFAAFLPADTALPWRREQRLIVFAIVDYVFVTYHFAAQHFGALSLYRGRAGRAGRTYARRMDRLFALGIGGVLVLVADILAGSAAYQEMWIDAWLMPAWLREPWTRELIWHSAMVVLVVATAAMLVAEARAERRSLPHMLYILGIAAMVAIALNVQNPFLFLVVSTSQHWIFAIGLASQTPSGEPAPQHGTVRRMLHSLNTRPWALLLFLMAASVLLLPFFEVEANLDADGRSYADWIFGAAATELRTSDWVPALVALGFSTGFVHYFLDRSVYRLSYPEVRVAARGLLARVRGTG